MPEASVSLAAALLDVQCGHKSQICFHVGWEEEHYSFAVVMFVFTMYESVGAPAFFKNLGWLYS